jgi:hypothetical protein
LPSFVLLGCGFFEIVCQGVELGFPKGAVLRDPRRGRLHGLGGETATVNAAIDFAMQQAGGFKDAQVLRDSGKGHRERRGKVLNGGFSLREAGQDGAARGVGEGAKGGVEADSGIVNHTVYYCTSEAVCQDNF